MPQVTVNVNNRSYVIACEDGKETHVRELAASLDRRVAEIAREVGQVGDARLMVLASLIVLDELAEAQSRTGDPAVQGRLERLSRMERDAARAIDVLAQRVEAVAARLEAT